MSQFILRPKQLGPSDASLFFVCVPVIISDNFAHSGLLDSLCVLPESLFSDYSVFYRQKNLYGWSKTEGSYATRIAEQLWVENNFQHPWTPIKSMDNCSLLGLFAVEPTRFLTNLFRIKIVQIDPNHIYFLMNLRTFFWGRCELNLPEKDLWF